MKTLRIGDNNEDVKILQKYLTECGYKCAVDGDFGKKTEAQVIKFQKDNGLEADGICGKLTWKKLDEKRKTAPEPEVPAEATELEKLIVAEAARWTHVREKGKNNDFSDPEFTKLIRTLGKWRVGWAWCACFTTVVWKFAFQRANDPKLELIGKLFTPSVIRTFNNFKKDATFKVVQANEPRPGALMCMRSKGNAANGHIGIVTSFLKADGTFDTIEGNTGARGLREGDRSEGVMRKKRRFGANGSLTCFGFIYPDAKKVDKEI